MGLGDKDMLFYESLPKFWQGTNSEIFNLLQLAFLETEGKIPQKPIAVMHIQNNIVNFN